MGPGTSGQRTPLTRLRGPRLRRAAWGSSWPGLAMTAAEDFQGSPGTRVTSCRHTRPNAAIAVVSSKLTPAGSSGATSSVRLRLSFCSIRSSAMARVIGCPSSSRYRVKQWTYRSWSSPGRSSASYRSNRSRFLFRCSRARSFVASNSSRSYDMISTRPRCQSRSTPKG